MILEHYEQLIAAADDVPDVQTLLAVLSRIDKTTELWEDVASFLKKEIADTQSEIGDQVLQDVESMVIQLQEMKERLKKLKIEKLKQAKKGKGSDEAKGKE